MCAVSNLKFGLPKKKRFTVDGDPNRVIEIDTGDTGILGRWNGLSKWFEEMDAKISRFGEGFDPESPTEEQVEALCGDFAEIDAKMREKLNYLFAADVCTPVIGEHGSLIRVIDGEPLFMVIIETLVPLYEADIRVESEKSRKRIEKHTGKYAK